MSTYFPKYLSRKENLTAILKQLTLNGETAQNEIHSKIGCSYRTIVRELPRLEKMGLTTRSDETTNNVGRPRYLWNVTFLGVLAFFGLLSYSNKKKGVDLKIVEKIAKIHSDKWVIFQEWNYICENDKSATPVLSFILLSWCYHNFPLIFNEDEDFDRKFGSLLKRYPLFIDGHNVIKLELLKEIIMFESRLYSAGEKYQGFDPFFGYLLKNDAIRSEIKNIIAVEDERSRCLNIFKTIYILEK